MKTLYTIVALLLCSMSLSAQSFDLKEALRGLASKNDTTNTDKGSTGSALGSILGNVLGKSDVTPADLEGTWNYTAPAVTFKSENLLKKAGGAAASATIENKIKPYYQRAGLENLVLTVANDSTFTMKLKRGSLSGSISQGTEKGILIFKTDDNCRPTCVILGQLDTKQHQLNAPKLRRIAGRIQAKKGQITPIMLCNGPECLYISEKIANFAGINHNL